MIVFGLSPEQARELYEHLAPVISGDAVYDAVAAVDHAAYAARAALRGVDSGHDKERKTHLRSVEAHARELFLLLSDPEDRPRVGTDPVDFEALREMLLRVTASAHVEANPSEPRRFGRPPLTWRDELVATICAIYPEETPIQVVVETLELVLGWIGADVQDVHGVVKRARRRRGAPHVTVKMHRPIHPGFQAASDVDHEARLQAIRRAISAPVPENAQ